MLQIFADATTHLTSGNCPAHTDTHELVGEQVVAAGPTVGQECRNANDDQAHYNVRRTHSYRQSGWPHGGRKLQA